VNAPGHPRREGAGYDCTCGECLADPGTIAAAERTTNIHMADGAPGPQVTDLTGGGDPLAAITFIQSTDRVSIVLSSAGQADRVIAAVSAAKELLTGGSAS
jgi:hypothetical protein